MNCLRRLSVRLIAILMISICASANAGLTGENVALIVNGSSVDSLTIANHYASLRNIPAQNIIVLDDVPSGLTISLDPFRDRILRPVLETINARGLAPQIHVIAYSAGFPTSINIASHTKRLTDSAQKKYQTPTASINSMTYFYRRVLTDSSDYLGWGSNFYARGPFARHFANPFSGEKNEQFQSALDAAEANEFQTAAETFETLSNEYPTLHPLCILAAENWMRAGDEGKALEQVREAIRHGWINQRHLTETEPLSKLFDPEDTKLPASRRRLIEPLQDVPRARQGPVGFSSSVGWTMSGHPVSIDQGAMPYMLSCVLAVIHENGSTLEQAVNVLERAVAADRTYPSATFGFSKTADVRSTTRMPGAPDALAWLLCRDQSVEIFSSSLPTKKRSYVGLMLGSAGLPVKDRSWSMAPGAIADNLTSLGGRFSTTSQTKLTEFLHAGAAISTGAVAEPYSLPPKFSTAMTYPYYNEGVTAIEALYLTITSPYQLLIVGDPLCQPYARAPNDFVTFKTGAGKAVAEKTGAENPSTGPAVSIRWQVLPDSTMTTPTTAMEFYLQGKLAGKTRPVANINVNLPPGTQGAIDTRVVLIGDHPTRPRIVSHEQISVGDEAGFPRIERMRKDNPDELTLFVECKEADRIEIVHHTRVVSRIEKNAGRITLTPAQIGHGPVRLQAIARRGEQTILGRTVEMNW